MPTKLSTAQRRSLARQGAANRIAELEAEIAAIHREFPDLANWIGFQESARTRKRAGHRRVFSYAWIADRVVSRRMTMIVGNQLGRLRSLRGYRAQMEVQYAAPHVEITRTLPCIVNVKNVGDHTWRSRGWHPVHLSYHWRIGSEVIEGIRFPLPADIRPGEQTVIDAVVPAPTSEGDSVLEFDMIREHVGWFTQNGSPTVALERTIGDYDYGTTYRQADLERDYWSVVGPSTKEQFEHLGQQKLQTLIALGMTPHSRVLDVGCGTGQLTEALLDYLSDDAVYCGTDIAEEAVRFCQRRFGRPNFSFHKNDMTRVPVEGQQFDVIFLASVFTHMYPAEIKAMLLDLKRLLAPAGKIVADVFVSPQVRTFAGSRSKVEINERHLKQLFDETGLTYEEEGCIVLGGGGKRLGFVFRHAPAATVV